MKTKTAEESLKKEIESLKKEIVLLKKANGLKSSIGKCTLQSIIKRFCAVDAGYKKPLIELPKKNEPLMIITYSKVLKYAYWNGFVFCDTAPLGSAIMKEDVVIWIYEDDLIPKDFDKLQKECGQANVLYRSA